LRELRYFNIAGDYPGEAACGLAGFREELPTFAQTYFLDLGEHLSEVAFSEAANKVASYILLNSVTPASRFFDAIRKSDSEAGSDLELRTFALESLGGDSLDVSATLTDQLCRAVVLNWRGCGVAPQDSKGWLDKTPTAAVDKQANEAYLRRVASEQAAKAGLDLAVMYKAIAGLIESTGQMSTTALVNGIVGESLGPQSGDRNGAGVELAPVLQKIHQFCGVNSTAEVELRLENQTVRDALMEAAQRHGRQIGKPLEDWILSLVDRTECRVAGAQQVAGCLQLRLTALVSEGMVQIKQTRQTREQLFETLNASSRVSAALARPKGTSIAEELRRYAHLLLQEGTLESVLKCLAVIEAFVCRGSDRLRDLWKDLNRLAEQFAPAKSSDPDDPEPMATNRVALEPRAAGEFSSAVIGEMADDAKDEIERSFLAEQCTLCTLLARSSHLRPQLVIALREAAKKTVRKTSRGAIVSWLGEALQRGSEVDIDRILGKCLTSIESNAGRYGGAMRLLLSLPDKTIATRIASRVREATGEHPTLACDPQGEMIAVYEIEQVPLAVVTNRLIRSKPDCESLASRLHTRTDVDFKC
jgi:hypothetical protein